MILSNIETQEAPTVEAPAVPLDPIDALIMETYAKNPGAFTTSNVNTGLELTLFSTHVSVKMNNILKNVTISDFRQILNSMAKTNTTAISALLLPYGCFSIGTTETDMQISCYYPGEIAEIKYQGIGGIKKYKIPLPNIIISHTLRRKDAEWVVQTTKYFCTPLKVSQLPTEFINSLNKEKEIYHLPLSNMYDTQNMCYGSNTMPIRHSSNLRQLDYFYQLITVAPFNNDLGIKGLSKSRTVSEWYTELSQLTVFPYKELR